LRGEKKCGWIITPVCDVDAGMLVTKVVVRPDGDVLIVWISIDFIVWAARKSVCIVCCPWFIFE
jgi:hypothetical protein